MIHTEDHDRIRVLRLDHGKVSALDLELCQAIETACLAAAEDAVGAVVLTGTGSVFSAGVDLFRILKDGTSYVQAFLPALTDALHALFTLEVPVVAAVNGHAIAGGCLLVQACDLRLMAEGKSRIGVPELQVGVPFPLMALEIMRYALPPEHLEREILGGATYDSQTALGRGLVDELVAPGQLMERALSEAGELAQRSPEAYALMKRELRAPALSRCQSRGELVDRRVLAQWSAPESHLRIKAYLDQTLGKGKS
ncbi:MAG: enoyl-CoA hydratase/isomerase family protein [Planctomycetes bacterium]|nr:enoyl-CoA hydratase/isomerase family protein [Planctomycetota bacterium]